MQSHVSASTGVGVEGEDVGGHWTRFLVARVAVNAVEHGVAAVGPEQPLIFKKDFDGDPTGGAHREALESGIVEGDDPLARTEVFHHFAEIADQRARPAEGIDAAGERGGDQFMEASHRLDAGIAERQVEGVIDETKRDKSMEAGAYHRPSYVLRSPRRKNPCMISNCFRAPARFHNRCRRDHPLPSTRAIRN